MSDHTRMPGPARDRDALNLEDVQQSLADAIDAVNRLGAKLAAATVQANLAEQQQSAMVEQLNEAQWGPSSPPPWNPNPGIEGKVTLSEAVGQALGTASMAWTPRPEGIFDSGEAVRVFEGIMAWLSDWLHEQVKLANEATAAKLIEQVKAHRDQYAEPGGVWSALEDLRLTLEGK